MMTTRYEMKLAEIDAEYQRRAKESRKAKLILCILATVFVGVPMVGLALHHASLSDSQRSVVERIFN